VIARQRNFVRAKVPQYALRIKNVLVASRVVVPQAFFLDKDGNTSDNGASFLAMELNKRTYLVFLSLVAAWCGGILLAPILNAAHHNIASALYTFYSPICHQIDGRSFHFLGEKLGVCARCSSIYFSFLLSLLFYPALKQVATPSLPKRHWIALAIIPMVIDVCLTFTGIHSSTLLTRAVTGALFGSILPFYLLPPLLEGIAQFWDQHLARGGSVYARKTQ
jgi:uncharacterized membrane protein